MDKNLKPINPDLHFRILQLLEIEPSLTQRALAKKLGISLGSANYCIKALINIGHIKANNFSMSKNKYAYLYILTPKGILEKAHLTSGFLKRKVMEYKALKQEIDMLKSRLLD